MVYSTILYIPRNISITMVYSTILYIPRNIKYNYGLQYYFIHT